MKNKSYYLISIVVRQIWVIALMIMMNQTFVVGQCPPNGGPSCRDVLIYTQTSQVQPYSKVSNYIQAYQNVNIASGKKVVFEAGNYVRLQPGFSASSGSNFHARIKPCSGPSIPFVSICVVPPSEECGPFTLTAVVGGGSGNYTYSWSNGLPGNRTVIADPQSPTNYSVTVVDQTTGNFAYTASLVDPGTYYLPFAVDAPSKCYGFGCDNRFYVKSLSSDPSKPYNAIQATLRIYGRWGGPELYVKTLYNNFTDKDLFWDGTSGGRPVAFATYYWLLELYNCANDGAIQGFTGCVVPIRPSNCSSRSGSGEVQDITSNHSYPNPVSSEILNFGTTKEKYMIYNSLGEIVKSGENADHVNVSSLSSGIYYLQLEDRMEKIEIQ